MNRKQPATSEEVTKLTAELKTVLAQLDSETDSAAAALWELKTHEIWKEKYPSFEACYEAEFGFDKKTVDQLLSHHNRNLVLQQYGKDN